MVSPSSIRRFGLLVGAVLAGCLFLSLSRSKPAPLRVLLALVAVGSSEMRSERARKNLAEVDWADSRFQFTCLVFVFAAVQATPRWVKDHIHCEAVYLYKYDYPSFVKSLLPPLVTSFDLLVLLLDDLMLSTPNIIPKLLERTAMHGMSVASAGVMGSYWSQPLPRDLIDREAVGRVVTHLEVFLAVFRPSAWRCFWELFDLEYETGGWIDSFMYRHCKREHEKRGEKFQMAIFDDLLAVHVDDAVLNKEGQKKQVGVAKRRGLFMEGLRNQSAGWARDRGIELKLIEPLVYAHLYPDGRLSQPRPAPILGRLM